MSILANVVKEAVYKKTDFDDVKSDLKKLEVSASNTSAQDGGVDQAKEVNVREMKVYQNVLSAVKYQRDAYIMGTDHADLRKIQRAASQGETSNTTESSTDGNSTTNNSDEPKAKVTVTYRELLNQNPTVDPTSMGSEQLTGLFAWFLPSPTMHSALLPWTMWTIAPPAPGTPEGGPLRRLIKRSVSNLIPLSQSLLDGIMKSNILYILKDESWKDSVKGSSRSYLGGGSAAGGNIAGHTNTGGRVVTTKTVRIDE